MSDCNDIFLGRSGMDNRRTNYNSQDYIVNAVLCNQSGRRTEINTEAILELNIEDDLTRWWTQGTITIIDNMFTLQRAPSIVRGEPGVEEQEYKFRGDGKDKLTIDIYPDFQSEEFQVGIPTDWWNMWLLRGDYVVYDVEDLPVTKHDYKVIKLYFWDALYQHFLERNVEWSTATTLGNEQAQQADKPIYMLNNNQRSMPAGLAIKSYFEDNGLEKHIQVEAKDPYTGYDIAPIDPGDPTAVVMYTSPAQSYMIDDLNYLLARQVGEKNRDLCIFRQERSIEEAGTPKPVSLRSLTDVFKLAGNSSGAPGPWQTEHFFVREKGEDASGVFTFKAPYLFAGADRDFKFTGHNDILSYRFVDWSGADNMSAVVHRPPINFAKGRKQFNYGIIDHTPEIARTHMKDNYMSQLYTEGGAIMMTMNNPKRDALNVKPNLTTTGNFAGRYADGLNKIILAGLHLNASLTFTVRGVTCRQPGRFVAVDKLHENVDSDYDNRVLGQWFVTRVHHRFANDVYENTLTAIKIHNVNETVKLKEEID